MECEKLAQEKTEMQRHYVMVSFSYLFIFTAQTLKKKRLFIYGYCLLLSIYIYLSPGRFTIPTTIYPATKN